MANHVVHNVVILQPKKVTETCCQNQSTRTKGGYCLEENCPDGHTGQAFQGSTGPATSLVSKMAGGKEIAWKRIEPSDFKPFYDTSISRTYTYAIKPPLLRAPQICEKQTKPHSVYSSTLTDRLLSKGSMKTSKSTQRELEEKWCIFDKELENLSQYDRSRGASRCHAIVSPIVPTIDASNIWKRVSEAIRDGQLPHTNACLKISEDTIHIFYFANNEDMVNEFLTTVFVGCVKLEKAL